MTRLRDVRHCENVRYENMRFRFLVALLSVSVLSTGCAGSRAAKLSEPMAAASERAYSPEGDRLEVMAAADEMPAGIAAPPPSMARAPVAPGRAPARPMPKTDAQAKGKQATPDKPAPEEEPAQHVIIYTGGLVLLVDAEAFSKTIDAMVDLATSFGGFVARHDERSITLRIPSPRFRESMKALEALGDVRNRAIEAQDVTEEYFDLGIRLKSLQATRKRLEELLARATNIREVLEVEEQLARVNGEIDRIEGRMRFLASHAAMSTINVTLQARTIANLNTVANPPPPPRTIPLPIRWLSALGVDRLLELSR